MATNLGESRKYKLYLTLISPYIGKFPHAKVLEKLDNNAGLKIGGRQSSNSKGAVANEKLMGISSASLDRLQTGKFYVKALSNPAFRIKNSSHLVGNQHAMSDGSWLKIIQQQIEAYYRPVQTPEEAHGRIPGSCLDMGLHSRLHGKRRKFSDPEVVDEDSREAYELHPSRKIGSGKVLELMGELMDRLGAPDHIRNDNGPGFVAKSWQSWLAGESIKSLSIDPGCPWQNGFVESFHDKFRRGCLARELCDTLSAARVVIAAWKKKYNELGPHRSLGRKTPEEFANGWKPGERWRAQEASCVTASDLHSGSLLTSSLERLSRATDLLTLSGP